MVAAGDLALLAFVAAAVAAWIAVIFAPDRC